MNLIKLCILLENVEGYDEAGEYDGNGGAELDKDVEGGAGGILERIANGVANNSSLVLVAALAAVVAALDVLLGIVPSAAGVGHEYCNSETGYGNAGQENMSDEACLEIPMAVLINGDSYSAAEFFGAALQEYGVAKLIGQPTTGKGHFQTNFPLSDGSAVVISIGKYCTPNGVSLTDTGLTPDILVEPDAETYWKIYYEMIPAEEDPQIQAALVALRNG